MVDKVNFHPDSYVRLIAVMGSDLSVANAARASFMKESEALEDRDVRLIRFLARDNHESPFRHAAAKFEFLTPLRQRLRIESVLRNNRNGFVFKPDLWGLLASASLDDSYIWRLTVSLAGAIRLIRLLEQETQYFQGLAFSLQELLATRFPHSIEALTGYKTPYQHKIQPARGNGEMVNVLDKGYVRLIDWLDGEDDEERIVSLEVKAPLMVRSQWFKYRVNSEHCPQQFIAIPWEEAGTGNGDDGSDDPMYARNEASRRYVTIEPEFYIPSEWRSAPEDKKQGSGGFVDPNTSRELSEDLKHLINGSMFYYNTALRDGIAPEQGRLFLPAYAMYTVWRWTASLSSVKHFLRQRLAEDAQWEIREYAEAVYKLVTPIFPTSVQEIAKEA